MGRGVGGGKTEDVWCEGWGEVFFLFEGGGEGDWGVWGLVCWGQKT